MKNKLTVLVLMVCLSLLFTACFNSSSSSTKIETNNSIDEVSIQFSQSLNEQDQELLRELLAEKITISTTVELHFNYDDWKDEEEFEEGINLEDWLSEMKDLLVYMEEGEGYYDDCFEIIKQEIDLTEDYEEKKLAVKLTSVEKYADKECFVQDFFITDSTSDEFDMSNLMIADIKVSSIDESSSKAQLKGSLKFEDQTTDLEINGTFEVQLVVENKWWVINKITLIVTEAIEITPDMVEF
ncbi:hypothetical protein [Fuchsiella alkaliacetigena]|uniref:hypothetical protein n=1 Tax=Fuchsiella alkaliacetigena TaxID=957042 RepID=UPI00200A1B1B|nr:hypothetical protein [Fuchsiella alkaliacetigena]MCK8825645.1 hypothetical protein [Fuchsiella alkaliacetigena]